MLLMIKLQKKKWKSFKKKKGGQIFEHTHTHTRTLKTFQHSLSSLDLILKGATTEEDDDKNTHANMQISHRQTVISM